MFDPTIYSLQSLPPSSPGASFSANDSFSGMDNPDDVIDTKDSGSLKDILVIGGSESSGVGTPLNDDVAADDSTESLSRKTSTASEYTSLSDYTPEHTVNTPSTSSSQATVSHLFRPEAIAPLPEDTKADPETTVEPPKPVATRKISRFLVSPAIMPVGELNLDPTSAKSLASAIASASSSSVAYQPVLDMLESGLYNPLSEAAGSTDPGLPVTTAQDMLDATNVLLAANNSNIAPRPPDQINTLEQLKIGLENITHAHVVQSQQHRKDAAAAAALVEDQQHVLDIDQQPIPIMAQQLPIVEPSPSQPFHDPIEAIVTASEKPTQQQPLQSVQQAQQPQQQPSGGSQNASVYNSRRTSADVASNDNTPTSYESPTIAGYTVVNEQQSQPIPSQQTPSQLQLQQQQQRSRLAVQQTSVDNSDG